MSTTVANKSKSDVQSACGLIKAGARAVITDEEAEKLMRLFPSGFEVVSKTAEKENEEGAASVAPSSPVDKEKESKPYEGVSKKSGRKKKSI